MNISRKIANFVLNAFQGDFPLSIKKIVTHAMIDQTGLQIAGSELLWSQSVYRVENTLAVLGSTKANLLYDSLCNIENNILQYKS